MTIDTKRETGWTALLPDGRTEPLDVAEGVRICLGDHVWLGRTLFQVVGRELSPQMGGWLVRLQPYSDRSY